MITRKCAINVASENWAAWTRPNLTANGTVGGASFAVEASAPTSTYAAWKAVDTSNSSYWFPAAAATTPFFTFYNPKKLKVTQLNLEFNTFGKCSSGVVYGSDDNSSWSQIASWTGSAEYKSVTVSGSAGYKYHKLVFTRLDGGSLMLDNIGITATELQ